WPDEISSTLDALDQLAVHVLGLDEVVAIDELHLMVGEEIVGQTIFTLEFFLILNRIARDAEHDDARFLEFLKRVAETAGFNRAAGGIGPRVKEKHDRLPLEVSERDVFAVLILQRKIFYFVADVHVLAPYVL